MRKISADTLWDAAAAEVRDRGTGGTEDHGGAEPAGNERTVFIVGSKTGGKTSALLRFLDRDEATKPTLALEYTFGRRARGHNTPKDIAHLWELGGGALLSDLVQIPITPLRFRSLSLVLVLDLSQPNRLWSTMETLLQAAHSQLGKACSQAGSTGRTQAGARGPPAVVPAPPTEHPDRELLSPFPVPLLIIGTKYDLFMDLDSDKRTVISKTLRFIAHYYAASLILTSTKSEQQMSKTKSFFNHLAFGLERGKWVSLDSSKPLVVPSGSDSFSQIGSPPTDDLHIGSLHAKTPYDLWKKAYETVFPPESDSEDTSLKDPASDPQYSEPDIDAMRAQRDQELLQYRRDAAKSWKELSLDT